MDTAGTIVDPIEDRLHRLERLARERPAQAEHIGRLLDRLLSELQDEPSPPPSLADVAQAIMTARRERAALLDSDIFRDPAWDMLLELYQRQSADREPSISDLCIAANVPATTGLRYIDSMERLGFLSRRRDRRDQRRIIVDADPGAMRAVERILERFARTL